VFAKLEDVVRYHIESFGLVRFSLLSTISLLITSVSFLANRDSIVEVVLGGTLMTVFLILVGVNWNILSTDIDYQMGKILREVKFSAQITSGALIVFHAIYIIYVVEELVGVMGVMSRIEFLLFVVLVLPVILLSLLMIASALYVIGKVNTLTIVGKKTEQ